ncbi:MAG: 50S ribosomal protein L10 [Candidatus Saccharibacteria bacterium]
MALLKAKKHEVVSEVSALLNSSKMTVITAYKGTTVKALQELRREARLNGTTVKVVKNRLVIKAIQTNENLKDVDTSAINGMLLYAFNSEDEVAPAQTLAIFAKKQPTLQFVGAINADGNFIAAEDVKALAALPSKDQLIGQVLTMLQTPVNDIMSALSGNLHGLLEGLETKANN